MLTPLLQSITLATPFDELDWAHSLFILESSRQQRQIIMHRLRSSKPSHERAWSLFIHVHWFCSISSPAFNHSFWWSSVNSSAQSWARPPMNAHYLILFGSADACPSVYSGNSIWRAQLSRFVIPFGIIAITAPTHRSLHLKELDPSQSTVIDSFYFEPSIQLFILTICQ